MAITVPTQKLAGPPLPVSTYAFEATLPAVMNANILYKSARDKQVIQQFFRGLNANADLTQSAANRTITYIGYNGETYTYIVNANGPFPLIGWGLVSIGAAIDADSLQVCI